MKDKDTFGELLNTLRINWVIVVAIVTFAGAFWSILDDVENNRQDIKRLEAQNAATISELREFRSDIVEIKTSLEFIKQQVSK